ncbi:MAG: type VI secretion system baseplate subunit TssG [Candidatus Eisenbacteria bacterium]
MSESPEVPDALEPEPIPPAAAALFESLTLAPYSFHLYVAMRKLEAAFPDKPRFGRSQRLKDDPVRFGQEPSLAFAPSTLASFQPPTATRPPRLDTFFFGLFGPNGPLPLHLTEYARDRERNSRDLTLRRFADLFHHRMLQLFYRAWADAQPTVQYDRPMDDRFGRYVGSLCGYGLDTLRDRDTLPDHARLHWAGLLAGPTRSAEGLERLLAGFFRMPVRVETFAGHWIHLPEPMLSRLGGAQCALGSSATLGTAVWDVAGKFRLVFGPCGYADFSRLLPGTSSLERLKSVVRSWVGDAMWWDVNVILKQAEVPGTKLDARSGLGWNTWLLSGAAKHDAADYILDPVRLAS